MKNAIILAEIAGVIGGMIAIATWGNPIEVSNEKIETVEVYPDWAQDEDAIKAAQDVIRRKELEKRELELVSEITGLQDEIDGIRKELGSY